MNRIIEYSIASAVIIATGVGCYLWNAYETDRSHDFQTFSAISATRGLLKTYSQQYSAYPALSDPFIERFDATAGSYKPLTEDGVTECINQPRCPWYVITFNLKTKVFLPKGEHRVTPQGIQ